jgi:hypothetical protein
MNHDKHSTEPLEVAVDENLLRERHARNVPWLWGVGIVCLPLAAAGFIYSSAWSGAGTFFSNQLNGLEPRFVLEQVTFTVQDWVRFDFRLTHGGRKTAAELTRQEPLAPGSMNCEAPPRVEASWSLRDFEVHYP